MVNILNSDHYAYKIWYLVGPQFLSHGKDILIIFMDNYYILVVNTLKLMIMLIRYT